MIESPLRFLCPSCEDRVKVPAKFAGRKGKCHSCGSVIQIPHLDAAPPPEEQFQLLAGEQPTTEASSSDELTLLPEHERLEFRFPPHRPRSDRLRRSSSSSRRRRYGRSRSRGKNSLLPVTLGLGALLLVGVALWQTDTLAQLGLFRSLEGEYEIVEVTFQDAKGNSFKSEIKDVGERNHVTITPTHIETPGVFGEVQRESYQVKGDRLYVEKDGKKEYLNYRWDGDVLVLSRASSRGKVVLRLERLE